MFDLSLYTQQAKACEFERELLAQSDGCMNINFLAVLTRANHNRVIS